MFEVEYMYLIEYSVFIKVNFENLILENCFWLEIIIKEMLWNVAYLANIYVLGKWEILNIVSDVLTKRLLTLLKLAKGNPSDSFCTKNLRPLQTLFSVQFDVVLKLEKL